MSENEGIEEEVIYDCHIFAGGSTIYLQLNQDELEDIRRRITGKFPIKVTDDYNWEYTISGGIATHLKARVKR